MRPTEDQQRALVAQREREAIAVELAGLRRDAERARWCEEKKADVDRRHYEGEWTVAWYVPGSGPRLARNATRNAAIDAAMRGKHA